VRSYDTPRLCARGGSWEERKAKAKSKVKVKAKVVWNVMKNEKGRRLYSVNRAWAAAVNIDFDYEVEKPPARYPIGRPRRGECNENGRRL
jgi:hypothetical protein